MALRDVKVTIDLVKATGRVGMGIPLILSQNAETEVEFTEVTSLAEVIAAGFDNTTNAYKAANLIFMQNDAPAKIAVCATSKTAAEWLLEEGNVSKDWRQLIVVGDDVVDHSSIMTVIEMLRGKMYFASLPVEDKTSIKIEGMERTVLFYCTDEDYEGVEVAALVGATAGYDAGSFTYKNIILKGIKAQNLTAAQVNAIHEKGGITVVKKAGDIVTTEGKVAGGEYIDIIDSKDYVCAEIEYSGQKLLNDNKKIPYDNVGIAMIEATVITCLKRAYNMGIIANNEDGSPAYSVSCMTRNEVDAGDRATRNYRGCNFSFGIAGAIHTVHNVVGELLI